MGISKKAIVVLVPSLLFGIGAPAWSGTTEQTASADARMVQANPYGNTLLGMLSSILTPTDTSLHQPHGRCKASQLYSQHDVVGDPEACIMGQYTIGDGSTPVAAP
jgi:hypothetical protein